VRGRHGEGEGQDGAARQELGGAEDGGGDGEAVRRRGGVAARQEAARPGGDRLRG
jgi:hypothetical protein